ncbi:TIGR04076 family protein [uncultured Megasphaera sp.]|uniref:TIGR04076 family protein n=1 Tax=uncultured Megasphaera sp. TaxID=165188 RepID=UPI00265B0890|nr:TIGR04076 family protein [uncultured Megasphaera sp.]
MDKYKVKLVVTESNCDHYKVGDEVVFDGPIVNKEKSGELCMTALQALYPYVFAGRQGSLWESPVQCPDCAERVIFKVVQQ